MHSILVIGGTGAQGAEVVRYLSSTGQYAVRAQTRNVESAPAKELGALPNVTLVTGGYDDVSLTAALEDMEYVFVNTDGFSIGQQAETYWGIRIFELARRAGANHLVYSGLDYVGPKTNFDPKYEVGHYLGKAYVAEYMKAQPTSPMNWSVIRSGPYMESLFDNMKPRTNEDSTQFIFTLPLGDGKVPFIVLSDFARYVDWLFAHPEQSTGLDLHVSSAHATGADIANAFTVTNPGKKGIYANVPISAVNEIAWAKLPKKKETKVGYRSVSDDRALLQTFEQNFTNWWNLYKDSVITRDYELLDRILPDRIRTVEEWMEKEGYNGEGKGILQHAPNA